MTERIRMTEQEEHTAGREGYVFRSVIGFMAMMTAIGGFGLLFFFEIPARNENAIMFALGAVFGWAGSVIASEYGASNTGRKVAESAIRKLNEPVQDVSVVNPISEPVPTVSKKEK
ncbi:MAG: hypothetical protein M3R04_02355 [bacterium]|nr:hypothetical protein [bacterium]